MFKQIRRKDKVLDLPETKAILKDGVYGMLSTISENGYPYVVPLVYVYDKGSIFFHLSSQKGHLLENLDYCTNVAFCVAHNTCVIPEGFDILYKSVIVFGKASEVCNSEKEEALLAFLEKYSGQHMEPGKKHINDDIGKTRIIKVEIEHITGKEGK